MSLGGLDSAAIKEAHEAANAEPGGWYVQSHLFSGSMGRGDASRDGRRGQSSIYTASRPVSNITLAIAWLLTVVFAR